MLVHTGRLSPDLGNLRDFAQLTVEFEIVIDDWDGRHNLKWKRGMRTKATLNEVHCSEQLLVLPICAAAVPECDCVTEGKRSRHGRLWSRGLNLYVNHDAPNRSATTLHMLKRNILQIIDRLRGLCVHRYSRYSFFR